MKKKKEKEKSFIFSLCNPFTFYAANLETAPSVGQSICRYWRKFYIAAVGRVGWWHPNKEPLPSWSPGPDPAPAPWRSPFLSSSPPTLPSGPWARCTFCWLIINSLAPSSGAWTGQVLRPGRNHAWAPRPLPRLAACSCGANKLFGRPMRLVGLRCSSTGLGASAHLFPRPPEWDLRSWRTKRRTWSSTWTSAPPRWAWRLPHCPRVRVSAPLYCLSAESCAVRALIALSHKIPKMWAWLAPSFTRKIEVSRGEITCLRLQTRPWT